MNEQPAAPRSQLEQLIASHAFFQEFSPQHISLLAEAAMIKHFHAGEDIFKQGDPANRFYIIQSGEVELLSDTPSGQVVAVQKIGAGEVLGWSWLFPPYYWHFGAKAQTETSAIFFYGTWLRESCERDHDFGYAMLKRMSGVVVERLQATRRRLVQGGVP